MKYWIINLPIPDDEIGKMMEIDNCHQTLESVPRSLDGTKVLLVHDETIPPEVPDWFLNKYGTGLLVEEARIIYSGPEWQEQDLFPVGG